MRFRASIDNVPTFFRIIQAIEKLQKRCIVKFTPTDMHIICNSDANAGGIQVWSCIKVTTLFSEYRIQSNAENVITLALHADALHSALRSAAAAPEEVTMKLAKKNDAAVLSFEIGGTTRIGRKVRIAHDVRIDVLKPTDVARLEEPLCPEPEVHIVLPPLPKLRTVVERLRPLADVLAIRADTAGHFALGISTESVRCETAWTACPNPKTSGGGASQGPETEDDASGDDVEKSTSVLVPLRNFLKFLNCHVISTTTIACICANHCLILYVYIGEGADTGGVLTFYVPAIVDDEVLA